MDYYLEKLNPETNSVWDEFVNNHPEGTLYHSSLWMKVLSRTFNYNQFSIAVKDKNENLIGILPLMLSKNPITNSKKISSLPMTTYCNNLLPADIWKEVANFIRIKEPHVDYVEFKSIFKIEKPSIHFDESNDYVNHVIEINHDPDYFFKNIFNKSLRRKINNSLKNGLIYQEAESKDDLRKFYNLLKKGRKKHNLPPLPYSFFENMWSVLKSKKMMFIPMITYENRVIAADIIFNFKNIYHSEYSASDSRYYNLGPNQRLLWELLNKAFTHGIKAIDLGRSHKDQESLIQFKEKWGSKLYHLHYYYYPKAPASDVRNYCGVFKKLNWIHYMLPPKLMDWESRFIYSLFG